MIPHEFAQPVCLVAAAVLKFGPLGITGVPVLVDIWDLLVAHDRESTPAGRTVSLSSGLVAVSRAYARVRAHA